MAAHDIIFFKNRSTGKIVSRGAKFTAPPSYGPQTGRRPCNAREEKQIAAGEWVDTDPKGKKQGDAGRKRSSMPGRSHLYKKSKADWRDELTQKYGASQTG